MKHKAPIKIVLGPTCAGKSSFILHKWKTKSWRETPVLFKKRMMESPAIPSSDCAVHFYIPFVEKRREIPEKDRALLDFLISEYGNRLEVYIILANRVDLLRRILLRRHSELLHSRIWKYPVAENMYRLISTDVAAMYAMYVRYFNSHDIACSLIQSQDGMYSVAGGLNMETDDLSIQSHEYSSCPDTSFLNALLVHEEDHNVFSGLDGFLSSEREPFAVMEKIMGEANEAIVGPQLYHGIAKLLRRFGNHYGSEASDRKAMQLYNDNIAMMKSGTHRAEPLCSQHPLSVCE